MAEVDGALVYNQPTGNAPAGAEAEGQLPSFGGAVSPTVYLMQAIDQSDGAIYRWTSVGVPDMAGAGFPGPSLPDWIVIAGKISPR
jgi:hypothetical protein